MTVPTDLLRASNDMPRTVHIMCSESVLEGKDDFLTYVKAIEKLEVEPVAATDPNEAKKKLDTAGKIRFVVTSVWMRESTDHPETAYEFESQFQIANATFHSFSSPKPFILEKRFHRIHMNVVLDALPDI